MAETRQKYRLTLIMPSGQAVATVTYMDYNATNNEIEKATNEGVLARFEGMDDQGDTVRMSIHPSQVVAWLHAKEQVAKVVRPSDLRIQ